MNKMAILEQSNGNQKPGRPIFLTAAVFNWIAGMGMLMGLGPVIMGGQDVSPGMAAFMDLFAILVMAFGVSYFMIAQDYYRYRPLIVLACIAKIIVVLTAFLHFIGGHIGWQLPVLTLADLVYAALFASIFLRYPPR